MGGIKPDWLSQLAPAHASPPPGWWPLALGWWGVIAMILIVVAVTLVRYNRPEMRIRRAALRELKQLDATRMDDNELARRLENLMRRYAVTRYGREQVANLAGAEWIAFVIRHQGRAFSGDVGIEFLSAAWGKRVAGQRALWLKGVHDFIKDKS